MSMTNLGATMNIKELTLKAAAWKRVNQGSWCSQHAWERLITVIGSHPSCKQCIQEEYEPERANAIISDAEQYINGVPWEHSFH